MPSAFIFFAALLTELHANTLKAVLDPAELPIPFQRYTTTDSLGRLITFYLSRPASDAKITKLPVALVALFIGGSGSQSLFSKRGVVAGTRPGDFILRHEDGIKPNEKKQ